MGSNKKKTVPKFSMRVSAARYRPAAVRRCLRCDSPAPGGDVGTDPVDIFIDVVSLGSYMEQSIEER